VFVIVSDCGVPSVFTACVPNSRLLALELAAPAGPESTAIP
jgi:hypothetical protein